MCVGIPGQIIEIVDSANHLATVEVSGQPRQVNLALLDPDQAAVGEWVLVHAGLAVQHLAESEARETLDLLTTLGQFFDEDDAELIPDNRT